MTKRRKPQYTAKQKANLSHGRAKRKKKQLPRGVFKRGNKFYRHFGTTMHDKPYRYGKHNPSSATFTKIDELQDKVLAALPRIDKARPSKLPRTMLETTMMLQFVLRFILTNVCMLSYAVKRAAQIFGWDKDAIYKATNSWLDGTATQPILEAKKKRGRRSSNVDMATHT